MQRPQLASALPRREPGADPPRDVAISGIVLFALVSYALGAAIAISSTIAVVRYGIEWGMFDHRGEFPRSYVYSWYLIEVRELRVTGVTGLLGITRILTSECVRHVCVAAFSLCLPFLPMSVMIWPPRSRRSSSPIFSLSLGLRGAGSSFYLNVCWSCSGVEHWVERCGVLFFRILQLVEICGLPVFFIFLHFVWRCGCCYYIFECWSFLSFASFVFYFFIRAKRVSN